MSFIGEKKGSQMSIFWALSYLRSLAQQTPALSSVSMPPSLGLSSTHSQSVAHSGANEQQQAWAQGEEDEEEQICTALPPSGFLMKLELSLESNVDKITGWNSDFISKW